MNEAEDLRKDWISWQGKTHVSSSLCLSMFCRWSSDYSTLTHWICLADPATVLGGAKGLCARGHWCRREGPNRTWKIPRVRSVMLLCWKVLKCVFHPISHVFHRISHNCWPSLQPLLMLSPIDQLMIQLPFQVMHIWKFNAWKENCTKIILNTEELLY